VYVECVLSPHVERVLRRRGYTEMPHNPGTWYRLSAGAPS
jgi:hypothetical protein